MKNVGLIGAWVVGLLLCGHAATAQDLGRYRDFELGSAVSAVSVQTGVAEAEFKQIHERPALVQKLTWRPRYGARRPPAGETESVEQMVFDFYDARLFRLTVDYGREQTAGLTDGDLIEALSVLYGSPAGAVAPKGQPSTVSRSADPYDDLGTRIAEWGDASTSVVLYRRSTYATTFKLVMTAEPVAALASTAAARAVILDAREAPQREVARQKKEADDRRVSEEKARLANKPVFRP